METFGSSSLGKQVTIVPGYAAYGTHREMGGIVGHKVIAEELTEILNDELAQGHAVKMLTNKGRQGGEKTVGHRLAIHLINNSGDIEAGGVFEGVTQDGRQLTLIEGVDKKTPQNSPAALIAEDIAEGRRIADNAVTIIQA